METHITGFSGVTCSLSSMRESDNRSSIRRAMREACTCMIDKKRSRAGVSLRAGPCNVSINPEMAASGVRIVAGIGDKIWRVALRHGAAASDR